MRLFCSWRSRVFGSAFILLSAMAVSSAQDRSPVATAVGQPMLIVSTSKIEQLMANVTYLLRAVNQPEIGGMATMTVNQFSRGLDRSRPIGVAVSVSEGGNPEPIVMLPISDLKGFFSGLVNFGEPEDLGDGLYTMDIGPQPVFAKQINNWLIVAKQEDSVKGFKQVPADLLQSLSTRYDVGVKVDVQSIPAQLRDTLVGQMKESYQRTSAQQRDRSERDLKKAEAEATNDEERASIARQRAGIDVSEKIQTAQIEQFEDMIRNTKQVVFGIVSDSANKHVFLEAASEFIAGSKLDAQVARSATAKTNFKEVQAEGQVISLALTDLIDPSQIPQIEQTVSATFDAMTKNSSKAMEAQAGLAELINEVKQLVIKSIQEGIIDGTASITLQSGLNVVTASRVADGKQLAASLQKAMTSIKMGDSAPQIKFNAYTHQGTAIHLGSVKLPSDADEMARKIFSETANFAIGTADKAVYVAIGNQAEANLKATLDRVAGSSAAPGSPMDLKIEAGPLLDYIQTLQPSPIVEAMIQAAQNYSNNDMLTVKSQFVPHGAVVRITIEEGILRAIGAGAKAGQGNRPGGF